MRIDIHYGRMRAEECTAGMDPGLDPIVKMASDTITTMRQRSWQLEQHCIDEQRIDRVHRERLRALKRSVRTAVDAALGARLPRPRGLRAVVAGLGAARDARAGRVPDRVRLTRSLDWSIRLLGPLARTAGSVRHPLVGER